MMDTRKLAGVGTASFLRAVVLAAGRVEDRAGEAQDERTIEGAAFGAVPGLVRRRVALGLVAEALRELAEEYPALEHALGTH